MSDASRITSPYGDPISSGSGLGTGSGTTTQDVTQRAGEFADQAKSKASELADQTKSKAGELGRNAVDKIDRQRESAASALSSAANTIRDKAAGQEGRVAEIATSAATRIESTANYLRDHDVRVMATDLEGVVRRNPGPSIVAALAVGFLLGTAFRRDRY